MGKDPLTGDVGGWLGGGKKQNSLIEMFGGPTAAQFTGAQAGQEGNVLTAQNMWNKLFGTATDQLDATAPARNAVIERANQVLGGNYNPSSSPAYAPMKRATEEQYGAGKNEILSTLAPGGTQQRALGNLSIAKGGKLSDAMSGILTNELSQAYNLGNQSYPQAIQGLTAALQGGAVPGQMMSSILQFLSQRLQSSVQGQGNMTSMI